MRFFATKVCVVSWAFGKPRSRCRELISPPKKRAARWLKPWPFYPQTLGWSLDIWKGFFSPSQKGRKELPGSVFFSDWEIVGWLYEWIATWPACYQSHSWYVPARNLMFIHFPVVYQIHLVQHLARYFNMWNPGAMGKSMKFQDIFVELRHVELPKFILLWSWFHEEWP